MHVHLTGSRLLDLKSKWIDGLTNQTWILAVVNRLHVNFNLVLASKAFER